MTAELEETIMDAGLVEMKYPFPQRSQRAFHGSPGRDIHGIAAHRPGRRQRAAVHLAVGIQRQGVQEDHMRRHHVVRQRPQQRSAQRGRRQVIGIGHDIRHQGLAGDRIGMDHHHRFVHLG